MDESVMEEVGEEDDRERRLDVPKKSKKYRTSKMR